MNYKLLLLLLCFSGIMGVGIYFIVHEQNTSQMIANAPVAKLDSPLQPDKSAPTNTAKNVTNNPILSAASTDDEIFDRLDELQDCYVNEHCPFANNDPREQYFEASNQIAEGINILASKALANKLNPTYAEIAQRFISFENDKVRESALNLMAAQPPESGNVPAIISGLATSHGAGIFRHAMVEFQRYQASEEQQTIAQFLTGVIEHGGHFASQEVAKSVLPLLQQNTIELFEKARDNLPQKSARLRLLNKTLTEYSRQQTGG